MNRTFKTLLILNLLALSVILAKPFILVRLADAQSSAKVQEKDNQELARLMDEDQADRMPQLANPLTGRLSPRATSLD